MNTETNQRQPLPIVLANPLGVRRQMADSDMDITPMIDITFLLLIFFLVGTKMQEVADIELPPARHGEGVVEENSVVITVLQESPSEVSLYTGAGRSASGRIAAATAEAQDLAVQDYVTQELTGRKNQVLLMAARDVRHRVVARIARAVGEVVEAPLYVAVLEDLEDQK